MTIRMDMMGSERDRRMMIPGIWWQYKYNQVGGLNGFHVGTQLFIIIIIICIIQSLVAVGLDHYTYKQLHNNIMVVTIAYVCGCVYVCKSFGVLLLYYNIY